MKGDAWQFESSGVGRPVHSAGGKSGW